MGKKHPDPDWKFNRKIAVATLILKLLPVIFDVINHFEMINRCW